ncbi:hypothetical protein B296_00023738 [Ensete ventricosum]|uniref:Uncharacterized protein n=1 Tax=Ensete ventricosum TaxID=4639 RepID=A0A426YQ38_ENSVE|nr:hypothetical protein B296_00023738 [Ensete ventricosum]
MGSRHLRPGHGRCLRLQVPAMPAGGCPYKGVLAVVGRPLAGGLGRSQLPLAAGLAVVGRPSSSMFLLRTQGGRRIGGGG